MTLGWSSSTTNIDDRGLFYKIVISRPIFITKNSTQEASRVKGVVLARSGTADQTCLSTVCLTWTPFPHIMSPQSSPVCLPPLVWTFGTATVALGLAAEDKCRTPPQTDLTIPLSNHFVFECQIYLVLGVNHPTASLGLPGLWKTHPWAQYWANSTGISRLGSRCRWHVWSSNISSCSLRS